MTTDRIGALRRMLERAPGDARLLFGLANEYEKQEQWEEVASHLQRYLAAVDDEGNAWGRLGNALRRLGRGAEARAAYQRGVEAAYRHGHPSMASEFEDTLADWDD